jgi:hypothetical protein
LLVVQTSCSARLPYENTPKRLRCRPPGSIAGGAGPECGEAATCGAGRGAKIYFTKRRQKDS